MIVRRTRPLPFGSEPLTAALLRRGAPVSPWDVEHYQSGQIDAAWSWVAAYDRARRQRGRIEPFTRFCTLRGTS